MWIASVEMEENQVQETTVLYYIKAKGEQGWQGQNTNLLLTEREGRTEDYYMALSHKDWELPNSRIGLPEMDIDRGLDFPI